MNIDYLSSCWETDARFRRGSFLNGESGDFLDAQPLGSVDGGIELLNTSSVTLQENMDNRVNNKLLLRSSRFHLTKKLPEGPATEAEGVRRLSPAQGLCVCLASVIRRMACGLEVSNLWPEVAKKA